MIPGEIYPAEVRATCHGVSAACGKLGAATGAFFFPLILGPAGSSQPTSVGLRTSMFLCAFIAFLGVVVTYFLTPKYGASELELEDNYLMLEHVFLQPSAADRLMLEQTKEAKGQGMMFEVVEAVYDGYSGYENEMGGERGSGGGSGSNDYDDVGVIIDDYSGGLVLERDDHKSELTRGSERGSASNNNSHSVSVSGGSGSGSHSGYQSVSTNSNR